MSETSLKINIDVKEESSLELKSIVKRKINCKYEKDISRVGQIWGADSYELNQSRFYNALGISTQEKILDSCASARLEEAYWIERLGMAYTAKMSLLAKSLDERKLYSQFSADESNHLEAVCSFIPEISKRFEDHAFINLLGEVISTGARRPLIFIIQVLLEGWGIEHYQNMFNTCRSISFGQVLSQIIKDEAAHHGSGLILFNENELTKNEFNYIIEVLEKFLYMVQVGPIGIVESVEMNCQGLTKVQKKRVMNEIGGTNQAQHKLDVLKKLIHKSESNKIISHMEGLGSFKAFRSDEVFK